jgi:hypothetical protein
MSTTVNKISTDNSFNLLILVIGLIFCCVLNTFASFSYKLLQPLGKSTAFIFAMEMAFAILQYCFKIPLYYYFAQQNVVVTIIIYISIYSIVVISFAKYILKESVSTHSIIILFMIVGLTILNQYLDTID